MARDQASITLADGVWTQLTNADVTDITFHVLSGQAFIRFTADTTTPTETAGIRYREGEGELQVPISSLTNLSGAVRVWAMPAASMKTAVYVDHA